MPEHTGEGEAVIAHALERWEGVPTQRSGRCKCGGELVEREEPAPGILRATLCDSCGTWTRWEIEATERVAVLNHPDARVITRFEVRHG